MALIFVIESAVHRRDKYLFTLFIQILQRTSPAPLSSYAFEPQLYDRALIDRDNRHILSRWQRIYFQHSPSEQAHPDRLLVACRHDPNRLERYEVFRCRRCMLAISRAQLPAVIFWSIFHGQEVLSAPWQLPIGFQGSAAGSGLWRWRRSPTWLSRS